MKAILIDPTTQTVETIDFDGDLVTLYSLLECDIVQEVPIGIGHVMLGDEEFLLKPEPGPFFTIVPAYHVPIGGKALIVVSDGERWTDNRLSVEGIRSIVKFPKLRFVEFTTTNEIIDHPIFGEVNVMRQTPVFEEIV